MKPLTHITAATRKRAENFKKIIASFGYREMMAEDIAELIGHTVSSGRKHAKMLVDDGVIEIARMIDNHHGAGHPVYRLAMTGDALAAFVQKLDLPYLVQAAPRKGPKGFHFHCAKDDNYMRPHTWERIAGQHDPLHAAFFGAAV